MKKIVWEKWEDIIDDKKQLVMHTPIGLVPYKIRKGSNNALNFWVCHTNFDINEDVYKTIRNVDGIEILSLFTPYSCRVCFGKLFNEKEVMKNVEIALGCERSKNTVDLRNKKEIIKIKKEISQKKHWCIYVLPNGSYEYFSTDLSEDFTDTINFYSNLKNNLGGLLLASSNKIGV